MLFMVLCSLTSTPLFSHHVKRYAHRVKDFVHRVKSFAPRGRLRLSCGRLPSSLHYAVTATLAPKGIIRSAAR